MSDARRAARAAEVDRLVADMERLRGPLRIAVRHTDDGLGLYIPPPRQAMPLIVMGLWLVGWFWGLYSATALLTGVGPAAGFTIWFVTWLAVGAFIVWVIFWQLFGEERLFFTSGALVREWSVPGYGRRKVVAGSDIRSVTTSGKVRNDPAGLGTVKLATTGRTMWVGSGLAPHEAQFVAELILTAAREASQPRQPPRQD